MQRRGHLTVVIFLLVCALEASALAQTKYPSKFSPQIAEAREVKEALAYADEKFTDQVAEWIRITEMPAKSTFEQKRGEYVKGEFQKLGLDVSVDKVGNVIGRRKGAGGGPTVVFAAHMDTVHPMDTDVRVTKKGNRLYAPGIFDNSASVANMLQAARALHAAGVATKGDVIFIATVQEELGLNGMNHWLDTNPGRADMVVALDGGLGAVNYGALGIYWSWMRFHGEGSHTVTSRGKPHPGRAAAQCILDIYTVPLPGPDEAVTAVYNVGMLEGGKVVNAIPQDVSFTVDLRTVDPGLLTKLDAAIVGKGEAAAKKEGVTFRREWIQKSEAGGRPEDLQDRRAHPIVQTAVDVLTYLGVKLTPGREAVPTGSTDANAAVVRKIPAISVGRSVGGEQHTLGEWAETDSARTGTKQIILLAAALAELAK
jgi:tripeptide aminopeptidase